MISPVHLGRFDVRSSLKFEDAFVLGLVDQKPPRSAVLAVHASLVPVAFGHQLKARLLDLGDCFRPSTFQLVISSITDSCSIDITFFICAVGYLRSSNLASTSSYHRSKRLV